MTGTAPEYQYHLKDHLGNVRMTFTTKNDIDAATATLENANIAAEQGKFLDIDKARRVNARIFDHTYNDATPTNGAYSTRLSGSANEKIGLARSLSVMPGDTITVEVYAKYVDPNAANDNALISILTAIANNVGVPSGTLIDGSGYSSAGSATYPFTGYFTPGNSGTAPKAYLNYLVFDRNFAMKDHGFRQISTLARETGDAVHHAGLTCEGVSHERLAFENSGSIKIKEPGYVYIWLSNEEPTAHPVEVFFDDFKVTHVKSPVIQSDSYYPFGGRFDSYTRENSIFNKRLYNDGSETVTDLGLEIMLTDLRTYDPWGRLGWWQIDPKTEGQEGWSPYHFSFNNPVRYNDPKGDCPPGTPCFGLLNLAMADAAAHPNGVGAHTLGVAQGLQNSAEGLYNAVTNPGQTLAGLGNLALAGVAGNPVNAMQLDATLGTNSYGAMTGVTNAISNGANNLINGNGIQRGTVIGEIGGAIIGSKGLGAGINAFKVAAAGEGFLFGSVAIKAPFNIPVQRFGAMSIGGESAFGLRTGTSPFLARTFSAITPKMNNLTNFTIGTIPKGTGFRIGITAPQGLKFPGGFLQLQVKPRLVINQTTKLVN